MKLFLTFGVLALLSVGIASSPAFAASIGVANSSFETLPGGGLPLGCGTGCSFSIDRETTVLPLWEPPTSS
jgi:hypothetical protein